MLLILARNARRHPPPGRGAGKLAPTTPRPPLLCALQAPADAPRIKGRRACCNSPAPMPPADAALVRKSRPRLALAPGPALRWVPRGPSSLAAQKHHRTRNTVAQYRPPGHTWTRLSAAARATTAGATPERLCLRWSLSKPFRPVPAQPPHPDWPQMLLCSQQSATPRISLPKRSFRACNIECSVSALHRVRRAGSCSAHPTAQSTLHTLHPARPPGCFDAIMHLTLVQALSIWPTR